MYFLRIIPHILYGNHIFPTLLMFFRREGKEEWVPANIQVKKLIKYCARHITKHEIWYLQSGFSCSSFVSSIQFSSVQLLSHVRLFMTPWIAARQACPSPTPGVHSDSRPSSQWFYPAVSFSVIPVSSCPQSLPASESFPMSQLFVWGSQSTGVSALASFLPKKSQGWSPSEWTG